MSGATLTEESDAVEDTEAETEMGTVELTVDGEDVSVAIPEDATEQEAAAIATAVGAHLHDRAVAAAAAAGDSEPERADEWKLAGRLKRQGRSRWPSDVRKGEEWKAAARSFY